MFWLFHGDDLCVGYWVYKSALTERWTARAAITDMNFSDEATAKAWVEAEYMTRADL